MKRTLLLTGIGLCLLPGPMLWAHPVVQTGDTLTLTYFGS